MTALLALVLALAPVPRDLVARLDAPSWRDREQADRGLRRRLRWPQAVLLELAPPAPPEARRRVRRAVDAWYHVPEPAGGWPRLDTIDGDRGFRRRYLERQPIEEHWLGMLPFGPTWPDEAWRQATACYVADLAKLRVPPAIVRALLACMAAREARWEAEEEARRRAEWRRMPDPLKP